MSARELSTTKTAGGALLGCGATLFLIAVWGLWHDIGWIAQPFYAYAWWGYILMLDGFSALRRGSSLLTTRRCFVLPMCLWSVTFWFFFELLNLRFKNWYYVGVFPAEGLLELAAAGLFTALCFATVFTGIFETYDALTASGLWKEARGRSRRFPAWVSYAAQLLGAAMAATAILFPYYLAPLIWGSFTLLIDPSNYRRGARSILRDIETREWGVLGRLFTAGLLCGLVWESLNFFAPQKWIYTVRGLEGLKLFEMPLLGFLGFPALAFDAMAGFALFSSFFLGNETWEDPRDVRHPVAPRPRAPRWLFFSSIPPQVAFWVLVSQLMIGVSFGSFQLELEDLPLSAEERKALREEGGIDRPRQLLRAAGQPERRRALAELLGDPARLGHILELADLYAFKGIGSEFGALLVRLGIDRVADLRGKEPEELHAALEDAARRDGCRAPRLDMVRVWVLSSRDRGAFLVDCGRSRSDGAAGGM